jgi:peptide methionine sulfoxide reductase msrA/msrB
MHMRKLLLALMALTATLPALASTDSIVLGMGCFWGAEKRMSELPGVTDVESGYANGEIAGTYEAILAQERALKRGQSNKRNHAEVVKVTFDPAKVSLETVLARFWESHDPTQGDRQGNDVGTNYRSAIYTRDDVQLAVANKTRDLYQAALTKAGKKAITTDIAPLKTYFAAEGYHQDYLKKNPDGYCGLGGTGVRYPGAAQTPVATSAATPDIKPLDPKALNLKRQLIVFEAEDCPYCKKFKAEVLDHWKSDVAVVRTLSPQPPKGWTLEKALFATPTIVLFENGKEVSRYTGYGGGDEAKQRYWKWLGFHLITPPSRRSRSSKAPSAPAPARTSMKSALAPSSIPSPARRSSAATPSSKAAPAGPASSTPCPAQSSSTPTPRWACGASKCAAPVLASTSATSSTTARRPQASATASTVTS